MIQAFQIVSCFEFFTLIKMSISRFANVFKVMNDEYRTNSKENGEKKLIREDNHFNESIDHDNFVPENKVFTIT